MATPHINAEPGDFAEAILLPGDPLRAKFIAETFLDGVRQVTDVRNMLGFTGSWNGMPVSVMGTGMGIPSAGIYITELIKFFDVQRLVRVGSCGGISSEVAMRDVILAIGACTDSGTNRMRYNGWDFSATADFGLLRAAVDAAGAAGKNVHVGNVHSSDVFYNPTPDVVGKWDAMGVLAVEMEAAGLYGIAAAERARALTVLTVSDHLRTQEETTSEERETTFSDMVEIALAALQSDAAG
jgi:purine-nucleoside phosphorylase